MLKGITLRAKEQRLINEAQEEQEQVLQQVCAMPMTAARLPVQSIPFGEPKRASIPRMQGGSVPIIYSESNFRDRYLEEYTSEILPPRLIRDAIIDELDYFNDHVWRIEEKATMLDIENHVFVRDRWVMCSKGDRSP